MNLRTFAEVSPLHLEPHTWERLIDVMENGPCSPRGGIHDHENPWHQLIGDATRYGCWIWTGLDRSVLGNLGDKLPASLLSILDDAQNAGADYVLFDTDVAPTGDWPVFEHHDVPGDTAP